MFRLTSGGSFLPLHSTHFVSLNVMFRPSDASACNRRVRTRGPSPIHCSSPVSLRCSPSDANRLRHFLQHLECNTCDEHHLHFPPLKRLKITIDVSRAFKARIIQSLHPNAYTEGRDGAREVAGNTSSRYVRGYMVQPISPVSSPIGTALPYNTYSVSFLGFSVPLAWVTDIHDASLL